MIKFLKHSVKNTAKDTKCRVYYSVGGRVDQTGTITIYAKGYMDDLFAVFGEEVENNSDMMTDYFEKDRVRITEDSPLYAAALARC